MHTIYRIIMLTFPPLHVHVNLFFPNQIPVNKIIHAYKLHLLCSGYFRLKGGGAGEV